MIDSIKYFVVEAGLSLWRGRRASVLSIATITLALFMLGLFLVASENLERLVADWSRSAEFSVYLQDHVSSAERAAIEGALKTDATVASVETVSKEQALSRFRRDFPDLAPATESGPDNPFPASLEARLKSTSVQTAFLERLAKRIQAMPGVADVRYDRQWLDRLASLTGFIRWAGAVFAGILVLAAALTVTNVVRLALFSRRDEIEIMELVGAPLSFIRGPFICEGVIQGGVGAALALVLLKLAVTAGAARLAAVTGGLIASNALAFLPTTTSALVVLGGMAVGCAGGFVAARMR
jgi:cell division transport system permease protein